jgi:hypothetical protein
LLALVAVPVLVAEVPSASYIFPAGGQQGATVNFKVGGSYLHGEASFRMAGPGVQADPSIKEIDTLWFEGPLIPMPASQQKEDYPRDHAGRVVIAKDAPLGVRYWHVSTSQGITPAGRFVIGRLPEVIEEEIDGAPIPTAVSLPITINGRIFPREDIDIWTLSAKAGETISCTVSSRRLGSQLNARLEVRDPQGAPIAEAVPATGKDPVLQWKAPVDGNYAVQIHDLDFGGLQHYVYRLTITKNPHIETTYPLGGKRGSATRFALLGIDGSSRGETEIEIPTDAAVAFPLPADAVPGQPDAIFLQVGDVPELLEAEPNDLPEQASAAASVPCVLNGRIQAPGDLDYWNLTAEKGQAVECELLAGELGSPLFPVMTVHDSAGKEIARSGNRGDPKTGASLRFVAPVGGSYRVAITEHFAHRGGPHYCYRLSLRSPLGPDFKLTLASEVLTVFREIEGLTEEEKKARPPSPPAKLAVTVQRLSGFAGEIELVAAGLPEGVHLANNKIAKGKNKTDLTFSAEPGAKLQSTPVTIIGVAVLGENKVARVASRATARGEPPFGEVLLAIAIPTPFYYTGDYDSFIMPRGTIFRRNYRLHRGDFTGPLHVRLADRQIRHLQGNHGPTITIPPGATEFEYGTVMAPCLEIGRTSRTLIMVYGTITDGDGSKHVVSYTSADSKHQFIGQMVAGLLSVHPREPSLAVTPGATLEVPIVIGRGPSLRDLEVRVGLEIPAHFKGVETEPVTVPAGQTSATLKILFAESSGEFNMPVKVIATTLGERDAHVAESPLEFVSLSVSTP